MTRIIKSIEEKYRIPALELVETVFTNHSDAEEGKLVSSLVEEIRTMEDYRLVIYDDWEQAEEELEKFNKKLV